MIDVKRKNGTCRIEAQGDCLEIASDILNVISDIYNSLKKNQSFSAVLFKAAITEGITNPECPTWEPQKPHKDGIEIVIPSAPRKGGEQDG